MTPSRLTSNEQMLVLQNEHLRLEIAPPGRYKKARFCWSGFISQVILNESGRKHSFCIPEFEGEEAVETENGFTGGAGLCNEFGIDQPVGYDDAGVGDWFTKLGVGLLRRDSQKGYRFHDSYEVRPFPLQVEATAAQICFVHLPLLDRGYAARLEQKLQLSENRLTIDYKLENLGTKSISTHEYRHNFLAIDGRGPALGMRLRVPFPAQGVATNDVMKVVPSDGQTDVLWQSDLMKPGVTIFEKPPGAEFGRWWELEWMPQGIGLREEVNVPLSNFQFFSTPRLISPEAFVNISVAPGQTQEWSRIYTFFTRSNSRQSKDSLISDQGNQ